MEPPDGPVAEPDWVGALLDETGRLNLPESHQNGTDTVVPTVRAEFVRRVMRADLGADQEPVLRAGIAALDRRLGGR